MYSCILIPRELSLVLTLHPNPMHVLEMSATVWSNTHLSPGTIFYPDEGEVRLDRIESRLVIPDEDILSLEGSEAWQEGQRRKNVYLGLAGQYQAFEDKRIRRFYGCYDAILNINGQEVRHCNWVRFVKTTTEPDDANIISSKVRGQSFYQVIRPIKPNEEITVLFHLTAERTLYDRTPSLPFSPYSPNLGPLLSYNDVQAGLFARQTHDIKPSMMTSTPLHAKKLSRDSFSEDSVSQRRSSKLESSSSASSSFASPQCDTPNSLRYPRGIPHESSFTSPMFTSGSSRETSGSDRHSGHIPIDASFVKEDHQTTENASSETNSDTSAADVGSQEKNDQVEVSESSEMKDQTSDNEHDQSKEVEVDVVNETNPDNDGDKDNFHEGDSENSLTDDDATDGNGDFSKVPGGEKIQPTVQDGAHTPYTQRSCHVGLSPTFKEMPSLHSEKSNLVSKMEAGSSTETPPSPSEINTSSLHCMKEQSHTETTADSKVQSRSSFRSHFEDIRSSETDLSSSPNETSPFAHKLPLSPKSASTLDLQSVGTLDHQQLKRCRERTWWPCDVCGKKFDRPSLLKRHTRTHTGEKPHACDVCGKAFSTSSSLNTHRRIHSGEKPHQCKTCGKRFTASSNLYYHRMTHNKEKPHKCDMCAKSFPTPGDLRSHMYIHNGSWPFRCSVCSRGFSKQTNLKNHMLLHSGDKPHECVRCGKKFALLCNLKTHIKTHDNSDSSDCIECLKCGTAMETSDDLLGNICKSCLDESSQITSKPSTPLLSSSLRQKGHTDFSISKLTSPDNHAMSEKSLAMGMLPAISSGNVKAWTSFVNSTSVTSHHMQMPTMYRQFFTSAADQHKWLLPSPSPNIFTTHFLPGAMKHPITFQGSSIKHGNELPAVSHAGVPAFITPEMMSLRGGPVFPSAANVPSGFAVHHGSAGWSSHMIAQGF